MHQILFPASDRSSVRVKLHLKDGRTDGRTDTSLCPSVRLLDGVWHFGPVLARWQLC